MTRAQKYRMIERAFELGKIAIAPLGDYEEEVAKIYYEVTPGGKIRIEKDT